MEREVIEEASIALIREYLNRKGCKQSLKVLDSEIPRSDKSICNRAELAQSLHIAPLLRKNKKLSTPFATIIEMLAWDLIRSHKKSAKEAQSPKLSRPSTARADFHGSKRTPQKPDVLQELDYSDISIKQHDSETRMAAINVHSINAVDEVASSSLPINGYDKVRPLSGRGSRKVGAPVMLSGLRVSDSMTKHRKNLKQANSVKEMLSASPDKIISTNDLILRPTSPLKRDEDRVRSESCIRNTTKNEVLGRKEEKSKVATERSKRKDEKKIQDTILQDLEQNDSDFDLTEEKCEEWLQKRDKPLFSFDPTNPGMMIDAATNSTDQIQRKSALSSPKNRRNKPIRSVGFSLDLETTPMTLELAKELRLLIFGSFRGPGFTQEWIEQSFVFNACLHGRPRSLRFGLKQEKGGPCGLLAAVQGFVLKHLLFGKVGNMGSEVRQANPNNLAPTNDLRTSCLAEAVVEILWRAGGRKEAKVAQLGTKPAFFPEGVYREDGITENIVLTTLSSHESLHDFIYRNIGIFEKGKSATILLLFSAVLTRGIEHIKEDMDDPKGTLIGAHGYCTQEMVNLLTTGVAASNVFNDKVELEPDIVLRGVTSRPDIGLLSLFEHHGSCLVGSYLKTPAYPIWLVCSESHFSILFSLNLDLVTDALTERMFHLYYYDGLANQDEEIKLTINTMSKSPNISYPHGLVPPLDLCIRTKWPKAKVDWNGTEPIL